MIGLRWIFSVGMILFLAACSMQEQSPVAKIDGDGAARVSWDRSVMEQVIASGYYTITDVALKPLPLSTVAIEALQGVTTLDPLAQVRPQGGALTLLYDDAVIGVEAQPQAVDSQLWAALTYKVLTHFSRYSEDIRADGDEQIYEALFDSALASLDIFSRYAGTKQAGSNRDKRDGYGAVDLPLKKHQTGPFIIGSIDPNTPVHSVGIRQGDELVRVNGESLSEASLLYVQDKLRGPLHSEVILGIRKQGTAEVENRYVWRTLVIEETVFSDFQDGILSLSVVRFNERTALRVQRYVRQSILEHGADFKGIILDLRNNPGGLLKKAVQVADVFLADGRIIATKGRHPDSLGYYDADALDVTQGRPVSVLMNGKSASAAEIVAAALQDRARAVIIGTSSYGKGTVQTVQRLPNNGEMTLTWSRLLAPSGYAFHGLGVHPDICTSGFDLERESFSRLTHMDQDAMMQQWRSVHFDDLSQRSVLRQHCAPNKSMKRIDEVLARYVIDHPSVYAYYLQPDHLAVVAP